MCINFAKNSGKNCPLCRTAVYNVALVRERNNSPCGDMWAKILLFLSFIPFSQFPNRGGEINLIVF